MSSPSAPEKEIQNLSPEEKHSALFANLVLQQANMAMMFLGRSPHPETGESPFDLESAQFMIDQLEMLRHKTKGNLNPQEEQLLQQSLTSLRMAFVEAVNNPPTPAASPRPAPAPATQTASAASGTPSEKEASRVKFTKKY